jgi:hypothetical protein
MYGNIIIERKAPIPTDLVNAYSLLARLAPAVIPI